MAPKKNSTLTGTGGRVAGMPQCTHASLARTRRGPLRARRRRGRVLSVSKHVLLVSWEYPPVVEGGLARHVRKLAEARAAAALADRLGVPYVTTVHATEHGRHQGWVQDHPQSHIHAVERWMAHRADAVIVCSYYMRGHVADIFDIAERRITVIPNGIDPGEMRAVGVLHSLYRIADLCVVPSIYEPFGLVALEAMASGCPCIVADTGGLREVVPRGERVGLRFNGGDAAHLGVMIERLLVDSRLRERLVAEASEHVLRFDWDDIAARTRGTYGELTGREGALRRAGELAARPGGASR